VLGAVQITSSAIGVSNLAGDAANAFGAHLPVGHDSVAELRADTQDQEADFLAERLYKLPPGYEIGNEKAGPHGA